METQMDTLSLQNIPEKLPLQMADCAVINADPTQPCHIDWTASPQKKGSLYCAWCPVDEQATIPSKGLAGLRSFCTVAWATIIITMHLEVAPIVGPGVSTPLRQTYDFWAIGKDCCSVGASDFRCGSWGSTQAHTGLREVNEADLEYYRLAVQQAASLYDIMALGPRSERRTSGDRPESRSQKPKLRSDDKAAAVSDSMRCLTVAATATERLALPLVSMPRASALFPTARPAGPGPSRGHAPWIAAGAGAVGMMASRSRSTQAQASSEGAHDGKTVFVRCIHSIGPVFPHLSLLIAFQLGLSRNTSLSSEDLVGAALAKLAADSRIEDGPMMAKGFTSLRGQDPSRVPYDSKAPLAAQVEQSIQKSLQNLGTTYIDSLVMHSPMPSLEENLEVWRVFERAVEEGKVRQLGISNCYDARTFRRIYDAVRIKPRVLQNRFYVESGYDLELRQFCLEMGIAYQSFWTLTANPHVLASPPVQSAAERLRATPAQILFRWLIQSGHQPLTGTKKLASKSSDHMQQDLEVMSLVLTDGEMQSIGQMFAPGVPHPIFLKWSQDPRGEVNGLHTMAFRNFLVFSASNLIFDILAVALASARYAFLGRSRAGYEEILNEAPAMPKDLAAHAYAAP
eukprot:s846_g14.t2